ncbi:MAG TPA: hypothetical protein VHM02_13500 [Thermoanaerobaculia bacterium]|nr:hypothetical protein [Thermoanaerobaculia bacterium]
MLHRLLLVLPIVLCAAVVPTARAEVQHDRQPAAWRQYAVKIVCGGLNEPSILNSGIYRTAVNVHNPDLQIGMRFWIKVAVALPGKPGPITRFVELELPADGALEIDCGMLQELAGDDRFVKGFAVLISREPLDVVAVYTAGRGDVASIHTERVPERGFEGPPVFLVRDEPAGDPCREAGCCCVTPRSLSGTGPRWPDDCGPGLECRAVQPGGVFHPAVGARIDVNVCLPENQPAAVPFIHGSQPPYCREP